SKIDCRSNNGIHVFGENIPEPIESFIHSSFIIPPYLKAAMDILKYEIPTPIQMQMIPIIFQKRNSLGCAPTGSGKTFSYLFPILIQLNERKGSRIFVVVIAPTKELSTQVLILDEGDLLFTEGKKGFKNQIATIYNACPPTAKHCIFSATISEEIERWADLHLENCVTVLIGSKNSPPESISQELMFVGQESGKIMAIRNMSLDPPVLVFVNTIDKARELFMELIYDGINVEVMHSDKTETQRLNIVNAFRIGKIWILITTDLMSRGIDFKGIKKVINFDPPNSIVNYIHRIGRTGRAGMPGTAVTFYTEKDIPKIKKILPILRASSAILPKFLEES
ncbi:hypothetical protein MXB_748, partial [Myxobolus squamalis]